MSIPSTSTSQDSGPFAYTPAVMRSFKPSRVFRDKFFESPTSINSITFDDVGETCVTASTDDKFHVWNSKTGSHLHKFASQKYGIDHVRFTHSTDSLLHTSTKADDSIRLHSLHKNSYISYFKGHSQLVTSLSMSPIDDTFISSSLDETVRLWDIRSPTCTGRVTVGHSPVVAYDNQGLIFAVARNGNGEGENSIYVYDLQNFHNGPFATMPIIDLALQFVSYPPRIPLITSLHFRPNGKHLLVSTSGNVHYILDAFSGALLRRLVGHVGLESRGVEPERGVSGEETCWTMDGKFVLGGSHDGRLLTWDLTDLPEVVQDVPEGSQPAFNLKDTLPIAEHAGHQGPTRAVASNPKNAMLATGAGELAFWLPEKEGAGGGGVGAFPGEVTMS
ncbi:WD40-repeat-containing domain protein [Mrakia frigida]|uniref:WD40-repeat-containing domain protein n=1 Tax=Mrakia frigida TaxID=29902 RepID=UPI003FCC0D10